MPVVVLAASICLACEIILASKNDRLIHWFLVPVFACGTLIVSDAIQWSRGKLDLFSPRTVLSLIGFHFFFLAPLLHVYWDEWMSFVAPPSDWRTWLGWMATLNCLALAGYRLITARQNSAVYASRQWRLDPRRFWPLLAAALCGTAVLQMLVYARYGGVVGYMIAYSDSQKALANTFEGMGWMFAVSESFPILAIMGAAVLLSTRSSQPSWAAIGALLLGFFAMKLLFGGLRGSRSNTIWGVFWAAGIIHLWLRPLRRYAIGLGTVFLVAFMYAYGFYKAAGVDALAALDDPEARADIAERSGRTLSRTVLADLSRADVQAFLLHRLSRSEADYSYAAGRTYLGTIALLIPRAVWEGRPPTKVKEGTELQYGKATYSPEGFVSSRVYGLAGEGMLNFGPLAVPLTYLLLGIAVSQVGRHIASWDKGDSRLLMAPFVVTLGIVALVGDSDNVLFYVLKNGAIPALVIYLSSVRFRRRAQPHQGAQTQR